MNRSRSTKQELRLKPTVVGTGLVALDVVVSDTEVNYFAGGTCGNVLTVLGYLGWDAKPIARLNDDLSAKWLIGDLEKLGIDTSFVTTTEDGSTPVIIQKIKKAADGTPTHSFSFRCPCCGSYLPGYKSILGSAATELAEELPQHQVFFFDRVSRGTLNLAKESADRGALVVFEPSGIGEPRLFREAWSLAHVVKYSNDRLRDIADLDLKSVRNDLLLEVETLGSSGLRYRSRMPNAKSTGWQTLAAIPTVAMKDAAGSGDWCTAGVLNRLSRGGLMGFLKVDQVRLNDALRYAQALAAWNCAYEGARGGMYQFSKSQFDRQIRRLLTGKAIRPPADVLGAVCDDLSKLCPTCESAEFSSRGRKTKKSHG